LTTFFTSDIHFGHANIIAYCGRPFEDVQAMNAGLIENWNNTVGPDDEVWVLGDVAMGQLQFTLPLVSQLNGFKILVPGNHDRCFPGLKNWEAWEKKYMEVGFDSILTNDEVRYFNYKDDVVGFHVGHFRIDDVETRGVSLANRPKVASGVWALHGHDHNRFHTDGRFPIHQRHINVGMDLWNYLPISLETIMEVVERTERNSVD